MIAATYEWNGMWHIPVIPLLLAQERKEDFFDYKIEGVKDREDITYVLHKNVQSEIELGNALKKASVIWLDKQMAFFSDNDFRIDYLKVKNYKEYLPTLLGSLGCPNTCRMCPVGKACNGQYKSRNIDFVLDEIQQIKDIYKANYCEWFDNNFFINPNWKIFAEELYKKGIKWAALTEVGEPAIEDLEWAKEKGLVSLYIGIESYNNDDLKWLNKKYAKLENWEEWLEEVKRMVYVIEFWMYGLPNQTVQDVEKRMNNNSIWQKINFKGYTVGKEWDILDEKAYKNNEEVVKNWKRNIVNRL